MAASLNGPIPVTSTSADQLDQKHAAATAGLPVTTPSTVGLTFTPTPLQPNAIQTANNVTNAAISLATTAAATAKAADTAAAKPSTHTTTSMNGLGKVALQFGKAPTKSQRDAIGDRVGLELGKAKNDTSVEFGKGKDGSELGSDNDLHKASQGIGRKIQNFWNTYKKEIILGALAVICIALAVFCPGIALIGIFAAASTPMSALLTCAGVLSAGLLSGTLALGNYTDPDVKEHRKELSKMDDTLKDPHKCAQYNQQVDRRIKFYKPNPKADPKVQKKTPEDWINWKLDRKVYLNVNRSEIDSLQRKIDKSDEAHKNAVDRGAKESADYYAERSQSLKFQLSQIQGDINKPEKGGLDAEEERLFTEIGMQPKTADEIVKGARAGNKDDLDILNAIKGDLTREGKITKSTTSADVKKLVEERLNYEVCGKYHKYKNRVPSSEGGNKVEIQLGGKPSGKKSRPRLRS